MSHPPTPGLMRRCSFEITARWLLTWACHWLTSSTGKGGEGIHSVDLPRNECACQMNSMCKEDMHMKGTLSIRHMPLLWAINCHLLHCASPRTILWHSCFSNLHSLRFHSPFPPPLLLAATFTPTMRIQTQVAALADDQPSLSASQAPCRGP